MCTIKTAAVIELNISPHILKSFDIISIDSRKSRINSSFTCCPWHWIDQIVSIFVETYSASSEGYQILFIVILFDSYITNKCNVFRISFRWAD